MSHISGTVWKRFNNGANCTWACTTRAIPKGMNNKIENFVEQRFYIK